MRKNTLLTILLGWTLTVVAFNANSQQYWNQINLLNELLSSSSPAVLKTLDNGMPVVGYQNTSGAIIVKEFDSQTFTWNAYPPVVTDGGNFDIEVSANEVYALVFNNDAGNFECYKFDTITNTWDLLHGFTSFLIGGTADLFGDRDNGNIYASFRALTSDAVVYKYDGTTFNSLGDLSVFDQPDVPKGYVNNNGEIFLCYKTDEGISPEEVQLFHFNTSFNDWELVQTLFNGGSEIEFFDIEGDRVNSKPFITWNFGLGDGVTDDTIYSASVNSANDGLVTYQKRIIQQDIIGLASNSDLDHKYVLHGQDVVTGPEEVQLHETNSQSNPWGQVGSVGVTGTVAFHVDYDFNRHSGRNYALYQYINGGVIRSIVKQSNTPPYLFNATNPKMVCQDAGISLVMDSLNFKDDDHDSLIVQSATSSNTAIVLNTDITVEYLGNHNPTVPNNYFRVYVVPQPGATGQTTITVTVRDLHNETATYTFDVTVGNASPSFTQSNYQFCNTATPISLNSMVNPIGGTFSGNGVLGNKFYPSVAGVGNHNLTYSYTNASGCTGVTTAIVEVLPRPTVGLSITNATCSGGDGEVDATISGGSSPYTINWSTGATTEDVEDLNAGVYYINVVDDNGCQTTKTANVSSDAFTVSGVVTNVSCFGGNDGAIDLTINGNNGPYAVEWLNNGSTSEDATGIVAGTWEVYVEDADGCSVTEVFEVEEPAPLTWTETVVDATCGSNDGSATCLVTGGTAPYDFQWFDDQGNGIGGSMNTLSSIGQGEYFVIITDDNGCSKIWNLTVNEVGGPQVVIDTVIQAQCTSNGAINISINSSNPITSIDWNNGSTNEDISGLAPGYYAVEVEDNAGCVGMAGAHIDNLQPDAIEICLVTVDTNTITNQVVWEKEVTTDISHYNVYRETSTAGQYQFVDSVLYTDESYFTDTIAYPHIRSWRYKISVVNNCGVESDLSASHKTIHLAKNLGLGGGINLSWDEYEGFTYPTYFIHRHTDINGWEEIAQVSTTQSTSYTDNPPSTTELDYFISIEPPSTCVSEKATSHNASRSNRSQGGNIAGPNGGGNTDGLNIEDIKQAQLRLYPNPTNDYVNVIWSHVPDQAVYELMDGSGKLVRSWQSNDQQEIIDVSMLEDGVYILMVRGKEVKQQYKVIKND